ncbi:chemoreceptor glutamine deamidase CheD [Thalassotalea euphylliae]|uniref:chemoreceptor glutamine deamidase CheD n=1 Tax=Thalassotalea euphylliae TaxID=1655234 RepID=UPI00363E1928
MVLKHQHAEVKSVIGQCLPEFTHVNHYWDKQRNCVVAKILPGEFYATFDDVAISTTLGSCIAACIWDEQMGIGGMNHFMLPITDKELHEVDWGQRGLASDATRYGNFAMEHLINTLLKNGALKRNLKAKVFGGGKVLKKMSDVGERNIDFVFRYLSTEGIDVVKQDVGLIYPRKVIFEPLTGRAFVKRLDNLHNDTIVKRETDYRSRIDQETVEGDVELF